MSDGDQQPHETGDSESIDPETLPQCADALEAAFHSAEATLTDDEAATLERVIRFLDYDETAATGQAHLAVAQTHIEAAAEQADPEVRPYFGKLLRRLSWLQGDGAGSGFRDGDER